MASLLERGVGRLVERPVITTIHLMLLFVNIMARQSEAPRTWIDVRGGRFDRRG